VTTKHLLKNLNRFLGSS